MNKEITNFLGLLTRKTLVGISRKLKLKTRAMTKTMLVKQLLAAIKYGTAIYRRQDSILCPASEGSTFQPLLYTKRIEGQPSQVEKSVPPITINLSPDKVLQAT